MKNKTVIFDFHDIAEVGKPVPLVERAGLT